MMIKKNLCLVIVLLLARNTACAQLFGNSSEIGIMAGPTFFQSDYGERLDTKTNFGNNGFGIGIFHVTNFSHNYSEGQANRTTFFNDHFKLKTELSFNKSDFRHYGKWVDTPTNTPTIQNQLRAMRGTSSVTNLGMQMEFYPFSIYNADLNVSRYNFAPYVSVGAQYNFFTTKSTSLLGAVDNPVVTPTKYLGASRSESNTTWSLTSSVGARYKVGDLTDIVLDLRWQYYFSDWVDGLNPDSKIYGENRTNDWQFWINVGYVFHIE